MILIESGGEINTLTRKKISNDDFTYLKVLGRGSFGKVMLVEKKDTSSSSFLIS